MHPAAAVAGFAFERVPHHRHATRSTASAAGAPMGGPDIPEDSERPVFYLHGTTDGLVAFSSATAQRDALIDAWEMDEQEVLADDAEHTWTRYVSEAGTVFEFVQHEWECDWTLADMPLRGHCFPGSPSLLGCGEDNALHWGETVMQFFVDHPKAD